MRKTMTSLALALMLGTSATSLAATPVMAQTAAQQAESARFTAFLDKEFAQEVAQKPQLATRLGLKQDMGKLDDASDAGQLKLLEWRRGSVARLKAGFDRAKLPPAAQASYDMWVLELDRAETTYKYRRYQPPFYSFLYSAHSQLPDFLINTHVVGEASDMAAYSRGCAPSPRRWTWPSRRAGNRTPWASWRPSSRSSG